MVLLDLIKNMVRLVVGLYEQQRARRDLLEMDGHRLYDIGLTQSEACEEGLKPVWKR